MCNPALQLELAVGCGHIGTSRAQTYARVFLAGMRLLLAAPAFRPHAHRSSAYRVLMVGTSARARFNGLKPWPSAPACCVQRIHRPRGSVDSNRYARFRSFQGPDGNESTKHGAFEQRFTSLHRHSLVALASSPRTLQLVAQVDGDRSAQLATAEEPIRSLPSEMPSGACSPSKRTEQYDFRPSSFGSGPLNP